MQRLRERHERRARVAEVVFVQVENGNADDQRARLRNLAEQRLEFARRGPTDAAGENRTLHGFRRLLPRDAEEGERRTGYDDRRAGGLRQDARAVDDIRPNPEQPDQRMAQCGAEHQDRREDHEELPATAHAASSIFPEP